MGKINHGKYINRNPGLAYCYLFFPRRQRGGGNKGREWRGRGKEGGGRAGEEDGRFEGGGKWKEGEGKRKEKK